MGLQHQGKALREVILGARTEAAGFSREMGKQDQSGQWGKLRKL